MLIFDEATAGLDVLVARALLKTVAELREQGKCVVFSTHIMREAERLCDRIAIMHRGDILAEGSLDELLEIHQRRRSGGVVLRPDFETRRTSHGHQEGIVESIGGGRPRSAAWQQETQSS